MLQGGECTHGRLEDRYIEPGVDDFALFAGFGFVDAGVEAGEVLTIFAEEVIDAFSAWIVERWDVSIWVFLSV